MSRTTIGYGRLVVCVIALAAHALAAEPKKEPSKVPTPAAKAAGVGAKWRVTVTTSMPGSPVAPPPSTFEFCQTDTQKVPFDANDPQQSGCKALSQQVSGATASWTMRCDRGMTMTGEGSITYAGDSFTGQTSMKGDAGGQSFAMTQQLSGRRVGDCKP